jgi:hypothetical protein
VARPTAKADQLLILRRVRQRLLVLLHPSPVPRIEIAAAKGAFERAQRLVHRRAHAFAEHGAARDRIVDTRDFHLTDLFGGFSSPENQPRAAGSNESLEINDGVNTSAFLAFECAAIEDLWPRFDLRKQHAGFLAIDTAWPFDRENVGYGLRFPHRARPSMVCSSSHRWFLNRLRKDRAICR